MDAASPFSIVVAPDLVAIVRVGVLRCDDLAVVENDERLVTPLAAAAEAARARPDLVDTIAAVRTMYKRVGIDPTRTRPSSEALLRRVRKGEPLPRVNSLVDVVNWCSLESQLPFGVYDRSKITGDVTLRLGTVGESYDGIRKDTVRVEGRLTLADAIGPFGNPTSDSARTMVTPAATDALIVIFAPAPVSQSAVDAVLKLTADRVAAYCRS